MTENRRGKKDFDTCSVGNGKRRSGRILKQGHNTGPHYEKNIFCTGAGKKEGWRPKRS
jgi:hypothetical protein